MSHIDASEISVDDVYELAYDIAQEFDKIIHLYGIDNVKHLVDKVIFTLEMLESSVNNIDRIKSELEEVKSNNLYLSREKIISDHEKLKLKQTFEEMEESWFQEVVTLKTHIASLKSENEVMKSQLSLKKESSTKSEDASKYAIEDQENIICCLRHTLKRKEKQAQDSGHNINTLNSRIQELLEMNKSLRLKNEEAKKDISKLIVEKNEYKSKLMLQKKENLLLNDSLNEFIQSSLNKQMSKKCLDNEHSYEDSVSGKDVNNTANPEIKLLERIKMLKSELQLANSVSHQYEKQLPKLIAEESKPSFPKSTIHQFFHLFLGVCTSSEFCWF